MSDLKVETYEVSEIKDTVVWACIMNGWHNITSRYKFQINNHLKYQGQN